MVKHVVNCESGKPVTFRVVNPRLIIVTPLDKEAEVIEDGNIVGLNYRDQVIVNRGDVLPLKGHKYKPRIFKRILAADNMLYGEGYYLYNTELTKSATFMLPLLGGTKRNFFYNEYLMNVFVGVEDDVDKEHIYLWYRYIPSIEMENFEEFIVNHHCFVGHMDVDKYHVLYKMRIPEAYKNDFNLLLNSKYSQIDVLTKDRILEFHDKNLSSPIGQVLFQDPVRKAKIEKDLGVTLPANAELFDELKIENEVFLSENIISNDDVLKTARLNLTEDME